MLKDHFLATNEILLLTELILKIIRKLRVTSLMAIVAKHQVRNIVLIKLILNDLISEILLH